MKKKIKFNKPFISFNSKKNLLSVLKNNTLSDGYYQNEAEKLIEKQIKSKYIILTQSCSDALEASIILLDIKKGDEVIMPSYTFTSTANCVLLRGGKPVFVDINEKNLNIDLSHVKKKITKKTKAIILVHYAGISCNMDEIIKMKKKHNLFIIEDAAHAYYAKYKNKYLGTIGDIGTFSFHESKNIVGAQGGAISINNSKLRNGCEIVFDKGTDRHYSKKKYYQWKYIGSEYKANELSSALIYSNLKSIDYIQSKREKIWKYYYNKLNKINNDKFNLINFDKKIKSAYHVFPIIFKNIILKEKFIKYMKKNKIDCFFHYYPLHLSEFGKKYSFGRLPVTEKVYNGLVRLPLYPDLKKDQIKLIVNKTKKFLEN